MVRERPPPGIAALQPDVAAEGFILHHVSKLDTLAGVAIKYGVEVADIKRANGLVTDFQMFAHKTIRIPRHSRHLPSTSLADFDTLRCCGNVSAEKAPNLNSRSAKRDIAEPTWRKKRPPSSSMDLLRGYYGLHSSSAQQAVHGKEQTVMALADSDSEDHSDYEPFSPPTKPVVRLKNDTGDFGSVLSNANPLEAKPRSRLSITSVVKEEVVLEELEKGNEKSVRRRSKAEANNLPHGFQEAKGKQDPDILDGVLPSFGFSSNTDSSDGMFIGLLKILDGALFGGKPKEFVTGKETTPCNTLTSLGQKIPLLNTGAYTYGSNGKPVNHVSSNQASFRPLLEGLSKPVRDKAALD